MIPVLVSPDGLASANPFLLFVRYPNGSIQILRFPTAFARGLVCITLGPLPVDIRMEDPAELS